MLKSMDSERSITSAIQEHIFEARLLRKTHDTLVYVLPLDKKHKYREVFVSLENNKKNWNIITMGISLTTLDDVFLKYRIIIQINVIFYYFLFLERVMKLMEKLAHPVITLTAQVSLNYIEVVPAVRLYPIKLQ